MEKVSFQNKGYIVLESKAMKNLFFMHQPKYYKIVDWKNLVLNSTLFFYNLKLLNQLNLIQIKFKFILKNRKIWVNIKLKKIIEKLKKFIFKSFLNSAKKIK